MSKIGATWDSEPGGQCNLYFEGEGVEVREAWMERGDIQESSFVLLSVKKYINAKGLLEVVENSELTDRSTNFLLTLNPLFLLLQGQCESIERLQALKLNRPQSEPWL